MAYIIELLRALENQNDGQILDLIDKKRQNMVSMKFEIEIKDHEEDINKYRNHIKNIEKRYINIDKVYRKLKMKKNITMVLKETYNDMINKSKEKLVELKNNLMTLGKRHNTFFGKIYHQIFKEKYRNRIDEVNINILCTAMYLKEHNIKLENINKELIEINKKIKTQQIIRKLLRTDRKTFNENITNKEITIKNLKRTMRRYNRKLKFMINIKRSLDNNKFEECIICMDLINSVAFNPCGHLYCHNCIKKIKNCALCRVKKKDIYQLYSTC